MASNTLAIDERIKIGKAKEAFIIEKLNALVPTLGDVQLFDFVPASKDEDMHLKVDAWCSAGHENHRCSVQIKYRETGEDLGIAMIRPYTTDYELILDREQVATKWDRDMQHMCDYYVCLVGNKLIVADGILIKRACAKMFAGLIANGGFRGNKGYDHPSMRGAELKLVQDRGAGYSSQQQKIICYISPAVLGAYINYV